MTTTSLPHFPALQGLKTTRVITKHYTNCAMYMDRGEFALLTWLIYESKVDNTVEYDTWLLKRFSKAIEFAGEEYKGKLVPKSVRLIRNDFKALVASGYLLSTGDEKIFMVNPMLSYRAEYVRREEYDYFVIKYKEFKIGIDKIEDFTHEYINLVQEKIKKKRL